MYLLFLFYFIFGKCNNTGILKWKQGHDMREPQQKQPFCVALTSVQSYHTSQKSFKAENERVESSSLMGRRVSWQPHLLKSFQNVCLDVAANSPQFLPNLFGALSDQ